MPSETDTSASRNGWPLLKAPAMPQRRLCETWTATRTSTIWPAAWWPPWAHEDPRNRYASYTKENRADRRSHADRRRGRRTTESCCHMPESERSAGKFTRPPVPAGWSPINRLTCRPHDTGWSYRPAGLSVRRVERRTDGQSHRPPLHRRLHRQTAGMAQNRGQPVRGSFFMAEKFNFSPEDCLVTTTVPYHIYGLLFAVLVPLVASARVAAGPSIYPQDITDAIHATRPPYLRGFRALPGPSRRPVSGRPPAPGHFFGRASRTGRRGPFSPANRRRCHRNLRLHRNRGRCHAQPRQR
jgi:hypothetical protein